MLGTLACLGVTTVVAFLGAYIGVLLGAPARKRLEFLVHVATGALLAMTVFDVLPEAKHLLSWPVFSFCVLGGYAVLWGVGRWLYDVCPACSISHSDEPRPGRNPALILLAMALGIHCALDGLAIVAGAGMPVSVQAGLVLGVGLHKFPEGLALALLLIGAGLERGRAFARSVAIESITIPGGLAGILFLGHGHAAWIGLAFAIVGGGFLYLVVNSIEGAFQHRMLLSRAQWITAEGVSFAATGVFLWALGRYFA